MRYQINCKNINGQGYLISNYNKKSRTASAYRTIYNCAVTLEFHISNFFFLIFVCFGDCLILYVCNYSSLITAWIQVDKLQFCLGVDIEIRSHRCSVSHKVFGLKFKCYSISREYIIREPHFYFGVANCCFQFSLF